MAQALERNCSLAGFRSWLCNHSGTPPTCSSVDARQRNTKDVNDLEVGEFHPNFCLDSTPHSSAYNHMTSIMDLLSCRRWMLLKAFWMTSTSPHKISLTDPLLGQFKQAKLTL